MSKRDPGTPDEKRFVALRGALQRGRPRTGEPGGRRLGRLEAGVALRELRAPVATIIRRRR